MPTFIITSPDGRKFRVTAPEGATREDALARVQAQAGEAPPKTNDRLSASASGKAKTTPPKPSSMMRELGRATVNTLGGVAEMATSPHMALEEAGRRAQRLVNQGLGAAGGGLLDAVGLPGAAAWVRKGSEGVERDLVTRPTVSDAIEQYLPPSGGTAGQVARFGAGLLGAMAIPMPKMPVMPKAPAVPSAASQIVSEGEKVGVRVMTSDLRPPKTRLGKLVQMGGENIPFAGTGGLRAGQKVEREDAVISVLKEYGGDDAVRMFDDAPKAIDAVTKSLTAKRARDLTALTAQKTGVLSRLDGAGVVSPSKAMQAIDDEIAALTGRNTEPATAAAKELQALKAELAKPRSLQQNEAFRKDVLSSAFKGDETPFAIRELGEKAVRKLYDPLRQDMGAFIKANGGEAQFQMWRRANERLSAMADDFSHAGMRSVLRNSEITPEIAGKLLFSGKPSDVRRLVTGLDEAGMTKARTALIQRAFDSAIMARGGLSADRFATNVTQLSKSTGILFKGADKARMEGLVRLLNATERAAQAGLNLNTGMQGTPLIAGYGISQIFGTAAIPVTGVAGLLARAYESAPVRDLLLGISKTKPGSIAEARLVQRAIAAIGILESRELPRDANANIAAPLAADQGQPAEQQQQQGAFGP